MAITRLVAPTDARDLADVLRRNRDSMAAIEPVRPDAYYTPRGQFSIIQGALERYGDGTCIPRVILDDDGTIVGRVNLVDIVRGPVRKATLGYFVDAAHANRGLASRAVAEIVLLAFGRHALHRIEAGTLEENTASQRVLEKNGFQRYGLARDYLRLNGSWRDHVLYERIAAD